MKTTFKKALSATGVIVLGTMFTVQAFANDFSIQKAIDLAKTYLPADAYCAETDTERYQYELEFISNSRGEQYEIEIDRAAQTLATFESQLFNDHGGKSVTLTAEEAKKVVLAEMPDAEFLSVTVDNDDWYKEYDVRFLAKQIYGEYELHTETGQILSRDIHFVTTDTSKIIDEATARNLAQSKAPNAYITELQLEVDNDRLVYAGEMRYGKTEYEFKIDAQTQGFIEWDVDWDD